MLVVDASRSVTITNSYIGNGGGAIASAGTLLIRDTVIDNLDCGVTLNRGGTAKIENSSIGPNVVDNNRLTVTDQTFFEMRPTSITIPAGVAPYFRTIYMCHRNPGSGQYTMSGNHIDGSISFNGCNDGPNHPVIGANEFNPPLPPSYSSRSGRCSTPDWGGRRSRSRRTTLPVKVLITGRDRPITDTHTQTVTPTGKPLHRRVYDSRYTTSQHKHPAATTVRKRSFTDTTGLTVTIRAAIPMGMPGRRWGWRVGGLAGWRVGGLAGWRECGTVLGRHMNNPIVPARQ